jgi:hypothetical protein
MGSAVAESRRVLKNQGQGKVCLFATASRLTLGSSGLKSEIDHSFINYKY